MIRISHRLFGSYEDNLAQVLKTALNAHFVNVIDKSGGCGESYEVIVHASSFQGVPTIKQHRMVQEAIKDDIKKWHAVSIKTSST
jgi:BolA-like protein 3